MNSPDPEKRDETLINLLTSGLAREASDLHLAAGYRPMYRVHGCLEPAGDGVLTGDDTARMITSVMPQARMPT